MTNEQLKIILEQQLSLLGFVIEKIEAGMPEDAERELEWWKGKHRTPGIYLDRSDHEERPTGPYIALKPLYDHREQLAQWVDELSHPMYEAQL